MEQRRGLRDLAPRLQGNQPQDQRHLLKAGDRPGPDRKPEIDPQGREQDEDEVEQRRPVAEHQHRVHVVAQRDDDDGRQRRLDQRICEARHLREIKVARRPVPQEGEGNQLIDQERGDADQREPPGHIAIEHARGIVREDVRDRQRERKQDREDDGEGAHALLLAANDLAAERVCEEVGRRGRHRPPN